MSPAASERRSVAAIALIIGVLPPSFEEIVALNVYDAEGRKVDDACATRHSKRLFSPFHLSEGPFSAHHFLSSSPSSFKPVRSWIRRRASSRVIRVGSELSTLIRTSKPAGSR